MSALSGKLPTEYTQLEFIQSNGLQHINTGFKPNNNTRVVIDVEFTQTGTEAAFGARNSVTLNNYALLVENSTFRSDFNTEYSQKWAKNPLNRVVIDKDGKTTTIDGAAFSYNESVFQSEYDMYIFAVNEKNAKKFPAYMKLYSCKIYDNGELIRDYIPCKLDSAGLYDIVNEQFYESASGTDFIEGPEIERVLPYQ